MKKKIISTKNFIKPTDETIPKTREHLHKCIPKGSIIIPCLFGNLEIEKGEVCYFTLSSNFDDIDLFTQENKNKSISLTRDEFIDDFLIDRDPD